MIDQEGKAAVIAAFGRRFCLDTLVETGTYQGDMVEACLPHFKRLFSIELGEELAARAGERFAGYGQVTVSQGDSGELLGCVLRLLQGPCLIWLDAHYSGGDTALGAAVTPVLGELQAISRYALHGSVVLIDDARDFRPEKGHPPLEYLISEIQTAFAGYSVTVEDDIVRITPLEAQIA